MLDTKILTKIKDILSVVDNSIEDESKLAMVKAFWEVGQLALSYQAQTAQRMEDIANDIDVHRAALQKYTQFYKTYPDGYTPVYHNRVVQWSMFVSVLPVHDKKAREFYLEEACRHSWDKYELIRRIKSGYYHELKEAGVSEKSSSLKKKDQQLYRYAAQVIKVVDGDTLDLEIDVGFKIRQEHRVRLRGINCPEMSTPQGEEAKKFVVKELHKCAVKKPSGKGQYASRPVVVVQTFKRGLYGRYIVDIYYLPGENNPEAVAQKGKLLNQVLLDKGLAVKA